MEARVHRVFPTIKKDPKIKQELNELNKPFNLNVPRSRCPKCDTQIRAVDNIPVISWFMLKGKCHKCANPISFRYPAIELLTAILCVVIGVNFAADWYGLALLFFTFTLVSATFIDLVHYVTARSTNTTFNVGRFGAIFV